MAGAGTMGSGITLACALADFPVILFDINEAMLAKAKKQVQENLDYLLAKEKITAAQYTNCAGSIRYTNEISTCKASLLIEAIVEKPEAKASLFLQMAAINDADCILASNTSSLSITILQQTIPGPERIAGLHFFNPAQVMKLVEVVKAEQTSSSTCDRLLAFCKAINKVPVLCKDAPGFIVNRVARHFYLRSLMLLQQEAASASQIDEAMEAAGFRMGPFKLMDLIGMDINYAVSASLYTAFDHAARFEPSAIQQQKVAAGELGRKTGKGFYDYPSK